MPFAETELGPTYHYGFLEVRCLRRQASFLAGLIRAILRLETRYRPLTALTGTRCERRMLNAISSKQRMNFGMIRRDFGMFRLDRKIFRYQYHVSLERVYSPS